MTPDVRHPVTERSDAARNRARLLDAAARLVAERGARHVTMQAVAQEAGVGKATLFRRFGDRNGLLLVLLGEAEAQFREAYTTGPPPLGPGASAVARLTAFGWSPGWALCHAPIAPRSSDPKTARPRPALNAAEPAGLHRWSAERCGVESPAEPAAQQAAQPSAASLAG